jgi:hypothetical protein
MPVSQLWVESQNLLSGDINIVSQLGENFERGN